jgi:nucleotide-binding universal stress UspA family protein
VASFRLGFHLTNVGIGSSSTDNTFNRSWASGREAQTTVLALNRIPQPTAGTAGSSHTKRLVVVVGYDGSPPARHALDEAAGLLRCRDGTLEVVHVSHWPASASLSGEALAAIMRVLDDRAVSLAEEVRARLVGQDHPWHFQRRDGAVVAELLAVAADLRSLYGDSAEVVIAVGGPSHRYHHLVGSVGASLARTDRFPVIVVP